MRSDYFFVFDVESYGLYGADFAVAFVVVDRSGKELDAGLFNCPFGLAFSASANAQIVGDNFEPWEDQTQRDLQWVTENVLPHMPEPSHRTRESMHVDFWNVWTRWQRRGASMWADWGYPVETNFLRECIFEDASRQETAPVPLLEVETICRLVDLSVTRRAEHLPAHDPLADARHSARKLIESLNRLQS